MRIVPSMRLGSGKGDGYREAEAVMREKGIAEIRKMEEETKRQINAKKEELRQLVGNRYRDLIDSADSILAMKASCIGVSSNIVSIRSSILSSLSSDNGVGSASATSDSGFASTNRHSVYSVACRVKYLVDTPENIWACLDETMFLEAASRFVRATHVHRCLHLIPDHRILSHFPLLKHQWLLVDAFKLQISQRSRDRLLDRDLPISCYADALAAVAIVDRLTPSQVLSFFLETRMSWIVHIRPTSSASSDAVISFFCRAINVILVTLGQVGELFLNVLNDMPLFYKVILNYPPASQLFGGIPSPEEEVRLWKQFREDLDSSMTFLVKEDVSRLCLDWLKATSSVINPYPLVSCIVNGSELASAEKLIRQTLENKQVLQESIEWLRSVFGSEIELPWPRIRELVLQYDYDAWEGIFEDAFVKRMKEIIAMEFEDMAKKVNVVSSISGIRQSSGDCTDFQGYSSTGSGVWFVDPTSRKGNPFSATKTLHKESEFANCLTAYLGPDISGIKDTVENHCQRVLNDMLLFLESPKADQRVKMLSPFLQEKCYASVYTILDHIRTELGTLCANMGNEASEPRVVTVERSLFIGRLSFAFKHHFKKIAVILGSPRFWVNDSNMSNFGRVSSTWRQFSVASDSPASVTTNRHKSGGARKQSSAAHAALLTATESSSSYVDEISKITRELCIDAYGLWISWLSSELSVVLKRDLEIDDALSATTTLKGWEETIIKQEQTDDDRSEMGILLPSMPSAYIISFIFRASEEVHRIGGHVIDKTILQKLVQNLLEKMAGTYEDFLTNQETQISDKGVLQILLDLRFAADVLSGGSSPASDEHSRVPSKKGSFSQKRPDSTLETAIKTLIARLSEKLDPIDWLTYQPYLWENAKQSYLRHAVLFGFFVQLERKYTDTLQNLPTNPESNIMRCSVVPRFKYLPISAPALSSSRLSKSSLLSSEDLSPSSAWKGSTGGEIMRKSDADDTSGFGVAAPILKSFMQVGSTLKLGSILTDGQVSMLKERSASAIPSLGDILPSHAAGLLSSFTQN